MKQLDKNLSAKLFMIVFMVMEQVNSIWNGHTDYALQVQHYNYQNVNFPNPYGLLWTWINPYFWDDGIYKAYLTIFTIAFAIIQLKLYQKKKLPFLVIVASYVTNFLWVSMTGYQHIIGTDVQSLAFWNPLFLAFWALMEFPVGNPAGWQCDFGTKISGYVLGGKFYQLCGPGLQWGSTGLIIWHLLEVGWCVIPAIYWGIRILRWMWKKWGRHEKS